MFPSTEGCSVNDRKCRIEWLKTLTHEELMGYVHPVPSCGRLHDTKEGTLSSATGGSMIPRIHPVSSCGRAMILRNAPGAQLREAP